MCATVYHTHLIPFGYVNGVRHTTNATHEPVLVVFLRVGRTEHHFRRADDPKNTTSVSVCFQNGGVPLVQNEGENDFLSQDQQLHCSGNTVELSVSVWIFVLLLFSWQFPMNTCSPNQTGDNLPTSAPPHHQGEQDGTFLPSMKW